MQSTEKHEYLKLTATLTSEDLKMAERMSVAKLTQSDALSEAKSVSKSFLPLYRGGLQLSF